MSKGPAVAGILFALVVGGGASAALEDDARLRFQLEPLTEKWLATLNGESRGSLEGIGDEPTGARNYTQGLWGERMPSRTTHASTRDDPVEWVTAPVPLDFKGGSATFAWMASVHPAGKEPKEFYVSVNGRRRFVMTTRADDRWAVDGEGGPFDGAQGGPGRGRILFDSVWQNRNKERVGYMRLVAPAAWLTPGKPLTIRIERQELYTAPNFNIFENRDVVAWLNAAPKPGAVCEAAVSAREGEPARLTFAARPDRAGKLLELMSGDEVLGQATLAPGKDMAVAAFEVAADKREALLRPLVIRVGGRPDGWARVDPAPFQARELLAQTKPLEARIRRGDYESARYSAAAQVLAWRQILEGFMTETDPARYMEFRRRARCVRYALAQLAQAVADFNAPGDVTDARRGFMHRGYFSGADGSGQIYGLYVPQKYDSRQSCGLEVSLHGSGGSFDDKPPETAREYDYFIAIVDGRGQNGFRGLGELDVLETLHDIRARYHIDPNRIWVTGGSMGGGATWYFCSRYPDLFAVGEPLLGWTDESFLENLANVPIWNYHDATDPAVCVAGSRAAASYLKSLGYPIRYNETTGAGHSVAQIDPAWDMPGWLHRQVRNPAPARVVYTTTTAECGAAYWLNIREFADPNRPASVVAEARDNVLTLKLENVEAIEIALPPALHDPKAELTVNIVAEGPASQPPIKLLAEGAFTVRRNESAGQASAYVLDHSAASQPARRAYTAGGMSRLYVSGEPLLIVKPAEIADAKLRAAVDKFCLELSLRPNSWGPPMPLGGIPVKTDAEFTAADAQRCNLILVGPASANRVLARIMDKLPAAEKDGKLIVGSESYAMQGRGFMLFHYNPEAPRRFLVAISSSDEAFFKPGPITARIASEEPFGLLLLEGETGKRVRKIAWDKQWRAPEEAFAAERLPAEFGAVGAESRLKLRALKQVAGADFALAADDESERALWDTRTARWHDLRCEYGAHQQIYVSTATGVELLAAMSLFKERALKAGADQRTAAGLWIEPEPGEGRIRPEATYRIAFEPGESGDLMSVGNLTLGQVSMMYVDWPRELRQAAASAERPSAAR